MDLTTVERIVPARVRDDLRAHDGSPDVAVLAGGTWLFSVPQPTLRTLVDVTTLGWEPVEIGPEGLRIAATCPISRLGELPAVPGWTALPLFRQCVRALLASFKVRSVATVGGNVCLGLPAGAMTSLLSGLSADATIWRPDGSVRILPVADLVTGDQRTALAPGEVVRSFGVSAATLRSRTAFRRLSLSSHGRSAVVVIGRVDPDGSSTISITAATPRPVVLRHTTVPSAAELRAEILDSVENSCGWFDDVHGAPDWRRATTLDLADQVRDELARGERQHDELEREPGQA